MVARSSPHPTVLNIKEILQILPHRYPFLLVDRVIELNLEKGSITGIKCLTINEQFFQGHFPNAPIMPGVLILEALAQVGGILIYKQGYKDKTALLLNVNQAKFRQPALPGDTLYLHAQSKHLGFRGGRVKARALVSDHLVAEAEIGFALREKEQIER